MRFTLLLSLVISVALFGANPKLYSGLGDKIYDTMEGIKTIQGIPAMIDQSAMITAYLAECERVRQSGLAADAGEEDPKAYLKQLRQLNEKYERLDSTIRTRVMMAVRSNNYHAFYRYMSTGFFNFESFGHEALAFYKKNRTDDMAIAEMDDYIAYQEAVKRKKAAEIVKAQAVYQKNREERIAEIRARQAAKKASFQEQVEAERQQKRQELLEEMKQKR